MTAHKDDPALPSRPTDFGDAPLTVPAAASPWPKVGVTRDERQPGARTPGDGTPCLMILPLGEALEREWPTAACVVSYTATNQLEWPRCNTELLPRFRAAGGDLLTTFIGIDVDNRGVLPIGGEGKKAWAHGEVELALVRLAAAADKGLWQAQEWSAFYTTPNGYRLLYVLKDPMPVDEAQPWICALIRDFRAAGIMCDDLHDWGRLFRLPRIVREGRRTAAAPDYMLQLSNERLDPRRMAPFDGPLTMVHERGQVVPLDLDMPDPSAAKDLLFSTETGKRKMTDWFKEARKRMGHRDCAVAAFGATGFGEQGSRYLTIMKAVGQACGLLQRMAGSTPELVFALFVDAGLKIDPATCRVHPFETIWGAISYCWAKEAAKIRLEQDRRVEMTQGRQAVASRVLEGMRTWCDDSRLHEADTESIEFMSGALIACVNEHRYVMRQDGYYDSVPVRSALLPARIRELGMDSLIALATEGKNQVWMPVSSQTLLDRHGAVVKHVEGVVGGPGTMIRAFGSPNATLVVRLFSRRTDLEPTYDPDIDQWLHHLFGDDFSDGQRWLAHAPDLEAGPICALSISGPPGIGKGLLAAGLAECFDCENLADGSDFGEYQGGLLNTAVMFLNEGLPSSKAGTMDVTDAFRSLVDGSERKVNEKFLPKMTVRNPVRVLIASNGDEVIERLAGHRDLSQDAQEALALRLLHIRATSKAADYLRMKGGLLHTGRIGRRWVRSANGAASDYVLAKHILHLYETRESIPAGSRLLVQGRMDGDIVRKLASRAGKAPDVIETVIQMIEANLPFVHGLDIADGVVYVTASGVSQFHNNVLSSKRRALSPQDISRVLASLVISREDADPGQTTRGKTRARWHRLDPVRLYEEAVEMGHRCDKLSRLVGTGDAMVLRTSA